MKHLFIIIILNLFIIIFFHSKSCKNFARKVHKKKEKKNVILFCIKLCLFQKHKLKRKRKRYKTKLININLS